MELYLLYLRLNQYPKALRISSKSIRSYLVLIFLFWSFISPITSQSADSSSLAELRSAAHVSNDGTSGEYQSNVSETYVDKFSSLSEDLHVKEKELKNLRYRLEAVEQREKKIDTKRGKELFKENIKTLELSEDQLLSELKLLRKGLKLLQANKEGSDIQKMQTLDEIEQIEYRIRNLHADFDTLKKDVMLEGVDIDQRDLYLNPPQAECKIVFDGIDSATNKSRKEVESELLFGYTHPKLKNFFKEKDFLTCSSKIVLLNKKGYLWLSIVISSKDALKNYGRIEIGSTLKFELLNGDILYLQSAQNAIGKLEAYTGNTTYTVILPLDKSNYRQLSRGEVDRVGIMWSSGYEQYEVYNIDLIMNQIQCLNDN